MKTKQEREREERKREREKESLIQALTISQNGDNFIFINVVGQIKDKFLDPQI